MFKSSLNSRISSGILVVVLFSVVMIAAAMFFPACAHSQGWGTAAGLLQGERLARVTMVYNDTLRASTDTTSWVPFGTHSAAFASERTFAPTRFTLFVKLDTANVAHTANPEVTLSAQLALNDTTVAYEQRDGSLILASATNPIEEVPVGQVLSVPVYGGGYLRFIIGASDSVKVRIDLWRVR